MYMRLSQCILILSWSLLFILYRRTLSLSSNQRLIFYYNFAIILYVLVSFAYGFNMFYYVKRCVTCGKLTLLLCGCNFWLQITWFISNVFISRGSRIYPAFDKFLPEINSMWCISRATVFISASRSESCIPLIAIREAQKIMNRNSLQSCTLSSGEIGEYITAVMVLLARSKEYLTLLAPVT